MSIIYDALKKVETAGIDDSGAKIDKGLDKVIKSKPVIYLLYALIICLGFLLASFIYRWLLPKPLLSASKHSAEPILLPVSPEIETKKSTSGFNLNGIFFSEDGCYALINNQIVREGDKIAGATVVEITLDAVKLDSNGTVIELPSKAR